MITLTTAQKQRLAELSAPDSELNAVFSDSGERDAFFREKEQFYIEQNRALLSEILDKSHRPLLLDVEDALAEWLYGHGFTRVVTPAFLTADMLARMTVDAEHPLVNQVFWLDDKRCLRPMLAPNLYVLMGSLRKITRQPVRIFECGSCFRKESQGSKHLNEFTMLNCVELAGVEAGSQTERLEALARGAMAALGIDEYQLVIENSEVYGETLDIIVNGEELASGAYGPHPLDDNWQITDPWVGLGFGLERIAMIKGGYRNIRR
ncbi:MAG: pyrrolysine--tRNA(Pyl) ligase large subunit, partial [Defluviitaleaceae bacterium]|nr:pyrrolysine--tRNA(Pyl) ligase large subunit [Defluviitaleaceae bacterium]